MKLVRFLALFFICAVLISGCTTAIPSGPVTLRFVVLPILEALPMYIAQQEGLFEEQNITVELITAGSAPERDQIISAGQADGMINELLSTILYNKDAIQVQSVRYARVATAEAPLFHILASAESGITDVNGLRGAQIGISQGTVIEYLTDRLLQAEGFSEQEIETIAVPMISDRMALLASGELAAGMLPDPLTFLAEQQGAQIVLGDSIHPDYSFSTITFRKEVIEAHPQAIRGFLAAIEEAVELINADPARWTDLLVAQKLVPEALGDSYVIKPFPSAGIPSQAQWDDVMAWAQENGLVSTEISYADSVTDAYLP